MSDYVLQQTPDGVWFAEASDAGAPRVDNVTGWDAIRRLLDEHHVSWSSPAALSRFRAQFGEPPADLDTQQMGAAPG